MKQKNELEIIDQLSYLKTEPDRKPEHVREGRAAFLAQAREVAAGVSHTEERRHKWWMHPIQTIFVNRRKEQSPMLATLATVLLVVSIVFGGGGVTVAAAQSSQPDQPLYGLKLLSEDVRFDLTSNPQSQYQLALEYTSRRAEEIQTMVQAGNVPPEAIQTRYQQQVEQAIRIAANLPDAQAVQALAQVKTRLQDQEQLFLQMQTGISLNAEAAVMRSRQMVQERLQWVDEGLSDPAQLRSQFRQQEGMNNDQENGQQQGGQQMGGMNNGENNGQGTQVMGPGMGDGNPWTDETPTPGSGYGPGPGTGDCTDCTPSGQSGNPWTTGTPTPGSSYGPGPGTGDCTSCTPSGGGMGGNPYTTGTPTPGSSYGPGPGDGGGMMNTPEVTPPGGNNGGMMPTQDPGSGMGGHH